MVDVGFLSMRENMIKFLQLGTLELVKSQPALKVVNAPSRDV